MSYQRSLYVPFTVTRKTVMSNMRCTVQNVVNVKLTNCLDINRHYESMYKELIMCWIWREALTPIVNIPNPVTHGWKVGDDGSLEINWIDRQPEPDEAFLNENESRCKWRWAMIVLLISFEQILNFSHVINCIVRTLLHIKTFYVIAEFSQISYFFGGGAVGV